MPTKKTVGYAKYRLSPLKQITSAAQAMRKKNPSMPWKDAVAKASKQYNNGSIKTTAKKAAVKKPAVKKKVAKKSVARKVKTKKSSTAKQGQLFGRKTQSLSGIRSTLCSALTSEYANLAADLVKATGKRASDAIKKKMRAILDEMKRQEKLRAALAK